MTNSSVVGSTFFGIDISGLGDQWGSWTRRLSKKVLLLEFGNDFLRLSETSITPNGIQLNHISRVQLPPEALERGVPTDPKKMAVLLQQICQEKKIRARRVAVVLQPEVGFQRIVDLPAELATTHEARKYLQDSKHGIQIPFPLAQTDFDLSPLLFPGLIDQYKDQSHYMLTAIPQLLINRVIETLQIADFELQLLELGSLSQLRSLGVDLTVLSPHQVDLVLELLPNRSDLMMVSSSGLLAFEHLSGIRDFPDPELDEDQAAVALDTGLAAESFVLNDESYLPLSDLDLRVLVSDFKRALKRFYELCSGCEIRCLRLAGINSAHPLLVNLLQDSLGLSVQPHRPLLSLGVSGFSFDDVLVAAGLGRLVGLGLGLLSRDQLLSCPIKAPNSEQNADDKLSGVGIDQLIDGTVVNGKVSELAPLPSKGLNSVDQPKMDILSHPLSVQKNTKDIQVMEVFDVTDELIPALQSKEEVVSEVKEEEEWPTIGGEELKEEVVSEIKEVEVANRKRLNDTDSPEQKDGSDDGLLLIPGLESDSPSSSKKQSSKTSVVDSSSTSDSLGELRFSDDD